MALTQEQVSQLYVALFGRASEGAGNKSWIDRGLNQVETANEMIASDAANDYFGGKLTNLDFVTFIYANTLGFTHDKEGIANWTAKLDAGISRGKLVVDMITAALSSEFEGSAPQNQLLNRIEVSNYMATNVEKVAPENVASTQFQSLDYPNGKLDVTHNKSTVFSAKSAIDKMSGGTVIDGETFTLTNSATPDTLIGTAKNDTFTGTESTFASGADIVVDQSTTDNDTLTLSAITSSVAATTVTNVENINIEFGVVPATTPTINASSFSGVENLTVSRADLASGAIEGAGAVTITALNATKVAAVTAGQQITTLTVNQATKAGVVVNADTVTTAVTTDGAATVNAAVATGTITVDGLGVTAENAKAVVVNAANASSVQVGQTQAITGSVSVNAAKATNVDITAAGGATVTAATAATAAATITLSAIDASGATVTTGTGAATTTTIAVELGGTAGATDAATVNAAGIITLDAGKTGGAIDSLTLSGTTEAVTYLTSISNGALVNVELVGDKSITVSGDSDDFTGVTITDSTTAGATTLKLTGVSAGNIDLSNVIVDTIDVAVLDLDNTLTVAANANVLVSKDQNTANLEIDGAAEDQTITISMGDDTVDASAVTILGGVVKLGATNNFATVNLNAETGAFTATSFDATGADVSVSGTKAVNLGNVTAKSINASTLTGVLTATMLATKSLTSGSANDVLVLNNNAVLTVNAGAGNNNITVTSAATGSTITATSGNDTLALNDADAFVINLGDGTNTVNVGAGLDIDSILVSGSGVSDKLDFAAGAIDLSNNTNFAFSGFETIDIADVNGKVDISAAQFNGQTFTLLGSDTVDILNIKGTDTAAETIDASGITVTTAKLTIDGGDKADILIGSNDGTTFIINDGDVDAGEIITGGTGTDVLDGSALTAAIDLSVATITGIETLYTNSANVTIGQGTGINTVDDGAASAFSAPSTFVLAKLTTSFGAAVAANNVDMAGEWNITDGLADSVLTYFDEATSTVETITFSGIVTDSFVGTGAIAAGNLVLTFA